ncbi:MAG TPA: hypothetical protein VFU43_02055 [Streptosporangiaceae bacterium]|nr:hypothetical protein [Streptosporangiaceae bacterium]
MPHEFPAWVGELTDPRRATTLEELADRLSGLAEHAIDVSKRLQALLAELNAPFQHDALYERVERLDVRATEAVEEVSGEISASGQQRLDRVWAAWHERDAGSDEEFRKRLDADVVPVLARQQRAVDDQVKERAAAAASAAKATMLSRVEELAVSVTELIHEILPLGHEGLTLASRISALSAQARRTTGGYGPIPAELSDEAAALSAEYDEAVARLELEWAALGARTATVKSALRAVEETAFSEVATALTRCVEEIAIPHVNVLDDVEAIGLALVDALA